MAGEESGGYFQRLINRFYQHDIAEGRNGSAEIQGLPIEGEEQSQHSKIGAVNESKNILIDASWGFFELAKIS